MNKSPTSRIYIGHVGEPAAGKETVGDLVSEWATENGFSASKHRFRDILEETLVILREAAKRGRLTNEVLAARTMKELLRLWSIEESDENAIKLAGNLFNEKAFGFEINIERETLQKLAQIMVKEKAFGRNALSDAVKNRLLKSSGNIVIADGMRWLSDETLIRNLPNNLILYITADFEVRLKRSQERNREGEGQLTREKFLKQNQAKNEKYIPEIGSRADWKIVNNYRGKKGLVKLGNDVWDFCEKKVRLKLNEAG